MPRRLGMTRGVEMHWMMARRAGLVLGMGGAATGRASGVGGAADVAERMIAAAA
ncbi:MAG: hypothetical protein U0821_07790 [Chloroflexota bacterium]